MPATILLHRDGSAVFRIVGEASRRISLPAWTGSSQTAPAKTVDIAEKSVTSRCPFRLSESSLIQIE
jgi:hypothetical protein